MIQAQAQLKFPSALAKNLRHRILAPSQEPFRALKERFAWDLFHVPGQYNHWRSSLLDHWGGKESAALLDALGQTGRQLLGCQHISKPWISLYQDGHYQRLHTDPKHGPFAFVLSLSDRASQFRGGETAVAKESFARAILDTRTPFEHSLHFDLHRLRIGDLLIFDGSLPHEVLPVSGSNGLEDSRLSLHGWFTSPEVMLSENTKLSLRLEKSIAQFVQDFGGRLEESGALSGYTCVELRKGRTKVLANTLREKDLQLVPIKKILASVPEGILKDFGNWIRIPLQLQSA